MGPRPPVQERPELPALGMVLEQVVAVRLAYLPRVVVHRLPPVRVPLHTRRVLNAQLPGQVLHHRPRHIQRVLAQEQAHVPHRAHLEREPELVMLRTPQRDQIPVHIVQEEEPLQLGLRRLVGELPVRLSLLIS